MKCRICNSSKIVKVIDLGKQPLANKYPKNIREIKKEKKFNLSIFFCEICRTAQIKNIISRKLMFEEYFYLSSVNKGLRDHFNKLAIKLRKYNFVIDIGSNDGILLKPLKKNKVKAIGIDPSFNIGKIANDRGLKTYIDFYDKRVINKIIKEHSKPDVLVASSVVTHLENPLKFAQNSKFFLKENGILIIEIEYLYNFIKNLEYERFYFDRPYYYSANSINHIFQSFDMSLFDIELLNIHGSSLRLYIKNAKVVKKTNRCKEILSKEKKYLNISTLKKINKRIIKESNNLKNKLSKFNKYI